MKNKYLLIFTILVVAIILSGCAGGIVTPSTEEDKIERVIHEYHLALSSQNWSKAKSYCIYGSDTYYDTCDIEQLANTASALCNVVTINVFADIHNVIITGNYSQVYCYGTILITVCGETELSSDYYYFLQKIGNSWKIL